MDSEKGFTLVELLVVVAVIGVLLGIGVVVFNNITDTTRKRADEATVRVLNSATMMLAITDGKSLATVFTGIADDIAKQEHLRDKGVLESVPKPAQQGQAFRWSEEALAWIAGSKVYVLTVADYISNLPGGKSVSTYTNTTEKNIEIPQGVTHIGGNAFQNMNIESVILPDTLTNIYSNAFNGNRLRVIVIPENVSLIGTEAFASNPDLTTIIMKKDEVTIQNNMLGGGWGNNGFRDAYTAGGAGTYKLINGVWTKTS